MISSHPLLAAAACLGMLACSSVVHPTGDAGAGGRASFVAAEDSGAADPVSVENLSESAMAGGWKLTFLMVNKRGFHSFDTITFDTGACSSSAPLADLKFCNFSSSGSAEMLIDAQLSFVAASGSAQCPGGTPCPPSPPTFSAPAICRNAVLDMGCLTQSYKGPLTLTLSGTLDDATRFKATATTTVQ